MTDERLSHIRNFSIIAHVDHGKSTLADRILELTGTIAPRDFKPQFLDRLEIERERGVTVKLQAVRIRHVASDGQEYYLNLIDTPGHVDFTYEVSRSLAACEGVLLVVDASQGIQAQTIANYYLAIENNLKIIPVINKIDLPTANIARVRDEIETILALEAHDAPAISAKEGVGMDQVMEAIVRHVPPPTDPGGPARALIFDSHYNTFRGVVAYVRMFSGVIRPGDKIQLMITGGRFDVAEVGFFAPDMTPADALRTGDVGYIIAGIKDLHDLHVGDTVTLAADPAPKPLPGYRPVQSMVYCAFFASESEDFENLRDALEKLALNDSALVYEPESSSVLGFGFRCGFLGLFHMEIIQERLEREHNVQLVATAPTVVYRLIFPGGEVREIKNPSDFPDDKKIDQVEEPFVRAHIITPTEFLSPVMDLVKEKRGEFAKMDYLTESRVRIETLMPLSEVIFDFFDRLKSCSRGYASLDYDFESYRPSDLVKLKILVGEKAVDSLSMIVHKEAAYHRGRRIVERLRKLIPRHMFEVPIQAAVGSRVISRETIPAVRKNVTAKCYGGDITRKRKLLEKQKEGKKRMKSVGSVEIPQEAFLSVLEIEKK